MKQPARRPALVRQNAQIQRHSWYELLPSGSWARFIVLLLAVAAACRSYQLGHGTPAVQASVMPMTGAEKAVDTILETGKKLARPVIAKNEAAPVGVAGVNESEAEEYIRQLSPTAVAEMHKFGIPASITLAQGLIESRAGTSKLARRNNNHFGMKCFSKKCAPGHCSNFNDDHHKDFFVKYPNRWGSFRAHSLLISSGRYAKLKKHGRDYRKWAYGLKSLGYATDRTYAEKLIGIIERYDLHQFDK